MWQYPNCGREFKLAEQHHFCTVPPKTIEDYIAAQPEDIQPCLRDVYRVIKAELPDAAEKISYQMPTFWKGQNLIHFAAQKNHLGIYPGAAAMEHFAPRLTEYKTSKGAIQFPYKGFGEEHLALISEIAAWCGRDNAITKNQTAAFRKQEDTST